MEPRSKPRWKFKPRGIVNHSSSRRPAVDAYSLTSVFPQSPGKRRNRPFKVLELDFSDYATNQASGIVLFEDYFGVARQPPESSIRSVTNFLLALASCYVSSPYRNSSGANSARFRRHTIQVCIPGVSISVIFTPLVLNHSRRLRLIVIAWSSVPHAIQSRCSC
jgi:hypothetical protein